jgi:hypothetical protein
LADVLRPLLIDAETRRAWGQAGRQRVHAFFTADRQMPHIEWALENAVRRISPRCKQRG